MSSGHDHSHQAGRHAHAPADFGRAFAIGVALNLVFVAVEAGFGWSTGSLALLADAGHNASDVAGLLIAWGAVRLAARKPSPRYSYGLKRSTILSALANGVLLMIAAGAIGIEAVRRLGDPAPVPGATIMWVAGLGIAVNAATAMLFMRGAKSDINIRGAYLHMAADAVVSLGVVVSGLLILTTGIDWIDPVTSLAVVAVIVWSSWGLLRQSIAMALDAVPADIDPGAVSLALAALPGVARVHDLHIWPMSTTETVLTAHLVRPDGGDGSGDGGDDMFLVEAAAMLKERFGIGHTTLQIERSEEACQLTGGECV